MSENYEIISGTFTLGQGVVYVGAIHTVPKSPRLALTQACELCMLTVQYFLEAEFLIFYILASTFSSFVLLPSPISNKINLPSQCGPACCVSISEGTGEKTLLFSVPLLYFFQHPRLFKTSDLWGKLSISFVGFNTKVPGALGEALASLPLFFLYHSLWNLAKTQTTKNKQQAKPTVRTNSWQ